LAAVENSTDAQALDPEHDTFPKLVRLNARRLGNKAAIREKDFGIWQAYTWSQYFEQARLIALGLASLGFARGDRVAIVGDNRPQLYWAVMAAQALGGVPVPIYQDSVEKEMEYIVDHAEARFAVVEDQEQVDKLLSVRERCRHLQHVVYDDPREVGPDRIANAVAARERYGAPCIVVDFGTSTNFDIVSAAGEYVGGVLAPGIEVSMEALFARAARLVKVDFSAPPSVIGKTTVAGLQSGMVYGFAGQVDGIVRRVRAEIGDTAPVVATGGLAELIAPHAETIDTVDPLLTLEGLRLVWDRNG